MTKIIVQALEITGQRGIINKGWGGLGNCKSSFPNNLSCFSLMGTKVSVSLFFLFFVFDEYLLVLLNLYLFFGCRKLILN